MHSIDLDFITDSIKYEIHHGYVQIRGFLPYPSQ